MFYKLDDRELATINKVAKMSLTDYELEGNMIPVDSLICAIEDLLIEIGRLEEKYNDLEEDMNENYKPIGANEMFF